MLTDTIKDKSKDSTAIGDITLENIVKAKNKLNNRRSNNSDNNKFVATVHLSGYNQLQNDSELLNWFDPVTRYKTLATGKLGIIFDIDFILNPTTENSKHNKNTMHVVPVNYDH